MKFERDVLNARENHTGRRRPSVVDTHQGCLLYTQDAPSDDEETDEEKDPLAPVEVLLHHLKKKFSPHSLVGKWKIEDEWKYIKKHPNETHESFFLRYELLKNKCQVHEVSLGPEESRGRHLFQALGMSSEQVSRVLELHDWKYPATERDLNKIIEGLQRKTSLTEGGNKSCGNAHTFAICPVTQAITQLAYQL